VNIPGNCPLGCGEGLILGEGGVIWCGNLLCPRPSAAAEILADGEAAHVITLDEDSFTVRHPLRERLDDALMTCSLHAYLAGGAGPPQPPGRYRVTGDPPDLAWTILDAGTRAGN
jgi:Family of unknown function (DUF6085)